MSKNLIPSTIINRENIAVNRFGYGARGDELAKAKVDPKKWLSSQLQNINFTDGLPSSADIFVAYAKFQKQKKLMKRQQKQKSDSQTQSKQSRKKWLKTALVKPM